MTGRVSVYRFTQDSRSRFSPKPKFNSDLPKPKSFSVPYGALSASHKSEPCLPVHTCTTAQKCTAQTIKNSAQKMPRCVRSKGLKLFHSSKYRVNEKRACKPRKCRFWRSRMYRIKTPLFSLPCSPPYPPPPEVPLFVFLRALLVFVVLLWCVDAAWMLR